MLFQLVSTLFPENEGIIRKEDTFGQNGAKHSPPAGRPSGGPHGNLATLAQVTLFLTPLEDMSSVPVA